MSELRVHVNGFSGFRRSASSRLERDFACALLLSPEQINRETEELVDSMRKMLQGLPAEKRAAALDAAIKSMRAEFLSLPDDVQSGLPGHWASIEARLRRQVSV